MASPEKTNFLDEAYQRLTLPQHRLGFTADNVLLAHYREMVRRELSKKGFIITPDIASAKDIVVPANGLAFVPVNIPEDFFPIPNLHPYALSVLRTTTRSRYAQAGLAVAEGGILHNAISVVNHSNRPVGLSKGEAFCYAYYSDGETMRGKELDNRIGVEEGAEIRIVGEENVDWERWYREDNEHLPENLEGVEFTIDPKSRRSISLSDEPIRLHGGVAENHLRGLLDAFLEEPIPRIDKPMFWVSESLAQLYLASSVHGILEWFVGESDHDFQTNSVLFKGGNTYGKMRYEIVSPITEDRIPKSVFMRFALNKTTNLFQPK